MGSVAPVTDSEGESTGASTGGPSSAKTPDASAALTAAAAIYISIFLIFIYGFLSAQIVVSYQTCGVLRLHLTVSVQFAVLLANGRHLISLWRSCSQQPCSNPTQFASKLLSKLLEFPLWKFILLRKTAILNPPAPAGVFTQITLPSFSNQQQQGVDIFQRLFLNPRHLCRNP